VAKVQNWVIRNKKLMPLLVLAVFVIAGSVWYAASKAATPFVAAEPENGTISAPAAKVTDSGASGGSAVAFKAESGGGGGGGGSCPAAKYTITSTDVSNKKNSGYPAGTQLYVPGSPDPWGGCFPNAANTGIPAGTTLTAYSGSCTITTANTVIDGKTINCDMSIRASNVTIKNSKITAGNLNVDSGSLTMQDVEVNLGNNPIDEGVKGSNLTILRANMYGGKRQIWCSHCTVQDSYLHDQLSDPSGVTHESSVRVDQYTTLIHNTVLCNAPNFPPDAGCSADQTGYPDFQPVHDNTMDKNFYSATTGGYCAYGGWNNGKPYNNDASNATNIHFTNNVFQRGTSPNDKTSIATTDKRRYTCGFYGVTSSFKSGRAGFQFTGNMWDDGLLFSNDSTYPYGGFTE
jgi:hypothetical protein